MTVRAIISEAEKLSSEERWELLDELLRMAHNERADVALTPAQATDLQRRLQEGRSDENLIAGDEAVAMLKKRA